MKAVSYIALALSVIALALGLYAFAGGFSSAGTALFGRTGVSSTATSVTSPVSSDISGIAPGSTPTTISITTDSKTSTVQVLDKNGESLATISVAPMKHTAISGQTVFDGFFVSGITLTDAGDDAFTTNIAPTLPTLQTNSSTSLKAYSDAALASFTLAVDVTDLNAKLLALAQSLSSTTLVNAVGITTGYNNLMTTNGTAVTVPAGASSTDFAKWAVSAVRAGALQQTVVAR